MGRFINADGYPSTGQGLTGNNMFAYCGNNPVSREDDAGEFWNVLIGAAVGAVTSVVTDAIIAAINGEEYTLDNAIASAAGGAVTGGLLALGVPSVVADVAGAATSTIVAGVQAGDGAMDIALDTMVSVGETIVSDSLCQFGGDILKNYVGGKYVKNGKLGKWLSKVVYEPNYMNERAASTIASGLVHSSTQEIIWELVA